MLHLDHSDILSSFYTPLPTSNPAINLNKRLNKRVFHLP